MEKLEETRERAEEENGKYFCVFLSLIKNNKKDNN